LEFSADICAVTIQGEMGNFSGGSSKSELDSLRYLNRLNTTNDAEQTEIYNTMKDNGSLALMHF
jgi:hypothetical protein